MPGPLDGVRVLDLTTVVMGPYATQILADFGADVVKVEPPEGDVMRHAAPMRSRGMGHIFLNANRNKRSIVLDLKKAPAREACLALARRADVLVYNIRPQAMARLKLAYDDVRAVNPPAIGAHDVFLSIKTEHARNAPRGEQLRKPQADAEPAEAARQPIRRIHRAASGLQHLRIPFGAHQVE